ncbi:Ldh family oxidoreductase [Oricola thermophila]|uniref:Ldh family oxidoreductase n=1 Tax=Oricola thermophila TaxID=2742145 RepID=A0A6N1VIA7_9HYPH|nr:Ldh family oxidoreductase [Oricola thermophila]QKV20163.1 Ldh family oxidoreductase [Oricola thermophila]
MSTYRATDLEQYAATLLAAGGFAAPHAEKTASVLVWANARGAESHGVLRIPRYLEMVEQGRINPVAEPAVVRREGAISILEADRAPGGSSMSMAMEEAVRNAFASGIGWCSARNISHAGAIGYYALEAARQDCIGIVMTASGPLMAYHGSAVAGVSTNPLAIAAPGRDRPLLLDMSTSTVALGKILAARDAGVAIPEGWGLDADGRPTTDPNAVSTVTPLGGPKGSGLSLMVEVLSSILVSNPVIAAILDGEEARMNGAAIAIRLSAFGAPEAFRDEVERVADRIRALPRSPGTDHILMPGERGFTMAEKRIREGIPMAAGTERRLARLAERLGVEIPKPLENPPPSGADTN